MGRLGDLNLGCLESLPGPSVDLGVSGVLGAGSALWCRVLQGAWCRGQGGPGLLKGSGRKQITFSPFLVVEIDQT